MYQWKGELDIIHIIFILLSAISNLNIKTIVTSCWFLKNDKLTVLTNKSYKVTFYQYYEVTFYFTEDILAGQQIGHVGKLSTPEASPPPHILRIIRHTVLGQPECGPVKTWAPQFGES